MEKNMPAFGKVELLGTSTSRASSSSRVEHKTKGSNTIKQVQDPIATLSEIMPQMMKTQTTIFQKLAIMEKEKNQLQEMPRPPYMKRKQSVESSQKKSTRRA